MVNMVELDETTQHDGCEPDVSFLQKLDGPSLFGLVVGEEVGVAATGYGLCFGQVGDLSGETVEQGGSLHHLSAVVGKLGLTNVAV